MLHLTYLCLVISSCDNCMKPTIAEVIDVVEIV